MSPARWRRRISTTPALDAALRAFAESSGRKLGQVAQPLRAALTGSTASPGIDATLAALGKEEALARLAAVDLTDGAKKVKKVGDIDLDQCRGRSRGAYSRS